MSNARHTPGPWKVAGPFDVKGGGRCLSIEAPNGLTVATVGFNEGDDLEACRADARLLAAGPALLATLEDVLRSAAHVATPAVIAARSFVRFVKEGEV